MFIDAGTITYKALNNIHAIEWGCITLIVMLTIYIARSLYTSHSSKTEIEHQAQFSTTKKQQPQVQAASAHKPPLDWRDGLLALTFFLAAHTIFWFSTYLPDAQDASATRTLGGVRFAWGFLIAIVFFKLFTSAHHKISQAMLTLLLAILVI
jgi:Ca2+/Na+ antiporter